MFMHFVAASWQNKEINKTKLPIVVLYQSVDKQLLFERCKSSHFVSDKTGFLINSELILRFSFPVL